MKWVVVTLAVFCCFVSTFSEPKLLAENTFMIELTTHEIVSILVVFLTVTMASIANIHLSLSRLKSELSARGADVDDEIAGARNELSSNAWTLFGLFCVLLILLLVKGGIEDTFWMSAIHGGVIIIIVLNLVILYDLYSSVYDLTSLDLPPIIHPGENGEDIPEIGKEEDEKVRSFSKSDAD